MLRLSSSTSSMLMICRILSVVVVVLLGRTTTVSAKRKKTFNLPLGDINIVSLTDTHSWVSGHGKHEDLDATYGHVLSFVERFKEMMSEKEPTRDIWFVMNGDFNDGTGLSQPVPSALTPILEQMPWDALTVGNHELYLDETFEHITKPGGFIQWFGKRYITSNVVHTNTLLPLGRRYTILEGANSRLLVFGFLYEMDYGTELKTVESIHDVLNSTWFLDVMDMNNAGSQVDAILVLAHMGVEDELVHVLLEGLREHVGKDMPIQFITGHTHNRGYVKLDDRSASFEAGRYLDTVGFVSFPKRTTFVAKKNDFEHVFLDAKVSELSNVLGLGSSEELLTSKGKSLLEFIDRTRTHLGINKVIGCSPRTFYLDSSLHATNSLWALYKAQVVPLMFPEVDDKKRVIIQNKHSNLRYSLFEGDTTMDDVWAVNPFNESFYKVAKDVPADIILQLNESLTSTLDEEYLAQLPDWVLIGLVEENASYDVYSGHFDVPALQEALGRYSRALPDTSFEPESIDYGTTQIWIDFVKQEWPNCSTQWHLEDDEIDLGRYVHRHARKRRGIIGIFVLVGLTLVVLGILHLRNRQAVDEELTIHELLRMARERSNRYLESIDFEMDEAESRKLT